MAEIHRIRCKDLRVKLLDEEAEILKMKAYEYGMSRSEFIRNLILFGVGKSYSREDRALLKEYANAINKIGNNLNQIAYTTYLKNSTNRKDMLAVLEEFHALLGHVAEHFSDIIE